MKKTYEIPELKVISLNTVDILTASFDADQPAENDRTWTLI